MPRGAPWRTLTASYPSTSCFIPTACSTEFQFPKSSVGRVVGGLQQLLGWDQVGPRGGNAHQGLPQQLLTLLASRAPCRAPLTSPLPFFSPLDFSMFVFSGCAAW